MLALMATECEALGAGGNFGEALLVCGDMVNISSLKRPCRLFLEVASDSIAFIFSANSWRSALMAIDLLSCLLRRPLLRAASNLA